MAKASTTIRVGADTTDYMRKMQQVRQTNRRTGQSITQMVPGMSRLASTAGLVATATQAIGSAWAEVNRRIREAQGMLTGPVERLTQLMQGVGALGADPTSNFERMQTVIRTATPAFAQEGDTPEQAMNRAIEALGEFTRTRVSGTDIAELERSMRRLAAAAERGLDPRAFARALGSAAEVGFAGDQQRDIATLAATTGATGDQTLHRMFGQYLRTTDRPTSEGFLGFAQQYQGRAGETAAVRAIQDGLQSVEGLFRSLATPEQFRAAREPTEFAAAAAQARAQVRGDSAQRRRERDAAIDALDIGPLGRVAQQIPVEASELASLVPGFSRAVRDVSSLLGIQPPRARQAPIDQDEIGVE